MQELRVQPEQMAGEHWLLESSEQLLTAGEHSTTEQMSAAEEHSPQEPEASTARAQAFPGF
jgi:hypothetical protein